jgi:MFS superfamily sulfate permease-like transporter
VVLSIVGFTLIQCSIVSIRGYQLINIPTSWFGLVGNFLLIALIMIPLCKRLVQGNSKIAKMVTIVNSLYIALLAVVLLCALATYTRVVDAPYSGRYRTSDLFLAVHQKRLRTAYSVLAIIGMLMAAANMLFALARGRHLRKGVSYHIMHGFVPAPSPLTWL